MTQAISKAVLSISPLRLLLDHARRKLGSTRQFLETDRLQKASSHGPSCPQGPSACLPVPGDESSSPSAMPSAMWKVCYDRGVGALKKNDPSASRWLEEAAHLNPASIDVQEALAGAALQNYAKLVSQGDQWMRQGQRQQAREAYAAACGARPSHPAAIQRPRA